MSNEVLHNLKPLISLYQHIICYKPFSLLFLLPFISFTWDIYWEFDIQGSKMIKMCIPRKVLMFLEYRILQLSLATFDFLSQRIKMLTWQLSNKEGTGNGISINGCRFRSKRYVQLTTIYQNVLWSNIEYCKIVP